MTFQFRRGLLIALIAIALTLPAVTSPVRAQSTAPAPTTPTAETSAATTTALLPPCPDRAAATRQPTGSLTEAATPTVSAGTSSVTLTPSPTLEPSPTANPRAGYLGISAVQIQKCGARIEALKAGSPAEKAGLAVGDVIVAINGKPITGVAELRKAVLGTTVGDKLRLAYQRGAAQKDVTVTMGEIPATTTATLPATSAATLPATSAATKAK